MTNLLIDDDETLRALLRQAFELEDVPVEVIADAGTALARIADDFPGAVITDLRMPGMDGLELFRRIHKIDREIPVIIMTGHGDVPMVIAAMKEGVFDFIPKPFAADHLIASVRRANEVRKLVLENRALRDAAMIAEAGQPLIGETPVMVRLRDTIRQLAQADVDVLIEGETGTGKELVALLLHRWGPRRGKPFVAVTCAALPAGLAETELLGQGSGIGGHHRGRDGRIVASHGGTLFIDETGSMPPAVQGIFLRVLDDHEVWPIGADEPKSVNLRIVAATHTNLSAAVERGDFRENLYYRLKAVQLRLPPLRERAADIPLLFAHFLQEASQRFGREMPAIGREIHTWLASHSWPGNVRELRSFAQHVLLGIETNADPQPGEDLDLAARVGHFEEMLIRRALQQVNGDIARAQERLGVARNTLYDKLKRYGIKPADFRS
jgi:two-component system C4-dicarboxylate transport response regulator DctD